MIIQKQFCYRHTNSNTSSPSDSSPEVNENNSALIQHLCSKTFNHMQLTLRWFIQYFLSLMLSYSSYSMYSIHLISLIVFYCIYRCFSSSLLMLSSSFHFAPILFNCKACHVKWNVNELKALFREIKINISINIYIYIYAKYFRRLLCSLL